jgi:hypothetical protein
MRAWHAASAVVLAALLACTDASVSGGEVNDAAVFAPNVIAPPAPGIGTKWSDLYRDIFSRTEAGGCAHKPFCHGSPAGEGWQKGLQCSNKDECYRSIFERALVNPGDEKAPEKAFLLTGLLRSVQTGVRTGIMPKEPADYVFHPATLKRIETWIRNGAPND